MSLKRSVNRREILCTAANAVACTVAPAVVAATGSNKKTRPERLPPQIGDVMAYPSWENEGAVINASNIQPGAKPQLVYPRDAAAAITRERSRLNQILLLRVAPDELSDATRKRSVDGLLAYSGVCTHTACAVSEWNEQRLHFICPCHASEFDPKNDATVINGPARRALPFLPIAVNEDRVVVAAEFSGRVGAKKKKH